MKQLSLWGEELPQLQQIGKENIKEILHSLLENISLEDFVKLITSEVDECIGYYHLTHGENTCKNASLLFNPHRLLVRTLGRDSVFESISKDSYIDGLARAMTYCYNGGSKQNLFVRAFEIGTNGVGYANEFPPYVARDLYLKYGVKKNDKVLDPCAGWGGRMLGCSCVCDNYYAFDPSTKTFKGLQSLGFWIKRMNRDFNFSIQCRPFEDVNLEDEFYDFALTSPPYYDTEEYTKEENNSLNRYSDFDSWCKGFYIPLIEKTMNALKRGGYFILNIGDRQYPLSDVMLDTFSSKYEISQEKDFLQGNTGGLRSKEKRGETFWVIHKI